MIAHMTIKAGKILLFPENRFAAIFTPPSNAV
jgi:hypothetical protein